MTQPGPPSTFSRKETIDKPGIVGARWWQESVATQLPRRKAMTALLAFGGVLAGVAAIGTCVAASRSSSSGPPDPGEVKFEARSALDMQKEYGWNFGATGEPLVFDGRSTAPFDRAAVTRMPDELSPSNAKHLPYYVNTLFQSPTAMPRTTAPGESEAAPFQQLKDALVPISTSLMDRAFKQGQALASLFDKEPRAKDVAIVVDLPGPEAVAFAAGASSVLDPVFLFDNWPHPKGVVPAHLTLAAAAYYQPMLASARKTRPADARPMFVLDRKRLTTYTDEATQFDNRHVARVPSAANLKGLGTKHVLYVSPNSIERQESDDLADDLYAYSTFALALHVVPATAFDEGGGTVSGPDAGVPVSPTAGAWNGPFFYGGSKARHPTFWRHFAASAPDATSNDVQPYTPTARKTSFSTGGVPTGTRTTPSGFGTVPVAIAIGTGVILGARLSRSGSWNRTPYGTYGGTSS